MKDMKEQSGLEEKEKKLYTREFEETYAPTRPSFYSRTPAVSSEWEKTAPDITMKKKRAGTTMFQKLFFASLAFFGVALAVSLTLFFSGGNVISSENVDIKILGPVAVPGGEELSLQISVTNKNKTSLQSTNLAVTYPEGTRSADGSVLMSRFNESLGEVKSGETVHEIVRGVLYGKEGTEQKVVIAVEYRVDGSNAIFVKEVEYVVSLSSAPLSVSVETTSEANANQEIVLKVVVSSNAQSPIEGVLLRAEYPFGFEPSDASPRPRYGTTVWDLGTIRQGDTIPITIKGVLRGQDTERKIFGFAAGPRDPENEREISSVYSVSSAEVIVKRPFLSVDAHIDGSDKERVVVDVGDRVPVEIFWANNLSSRITDVSIEAHLEGSGFDKSSVQVAGGFYKSSDNRIIWNGESTKDLASIDAGVSGTVSFAFIPATTKAGVQITNPNARMNINIRGRRVNEQGATDDVSSVITRDIVVNSDLRLAPRTLYYSGPFQNTGSMPPRADTKTSYTIVWTVTNTSNDVGGVTVRGVLPPYVSWMGKIDPPTASVSYDEKTGAILWRTGDVDAGAGFSRGAPEVAFQVVLASSLSHIGKSPELMTSITFSGIDQFTGTALTGTRAPLTTNLSTDPLSKSIDAQVVK